MTSLVCGRVDEVSGMWVWITTEVSAVLVFFKGLVQKICSLFAKELRCSYPSLWRGFFSILIFLKFCYFLILLFSFLRNRVLISKITETKVEENGNFIKLCSHNKFF